MATTNGRTRGARAVNKLKTVKSTDERMGARTKAAQAKTKAANKKRDMSKDAVMGRRAKAAQTTGKVKAEYRKDAAAAKNSKAVRPKANAPMKKETVAPKKKPVNVGNVSKPKRGQRAATSAAKAVKKPTPKNVVRSSSGKAVRTGSGGVLKTRDYSKMSQDEIDKLFS